MSGLLSAWPGKVARIACGVIFVCSVMVVGQVPDNVQHIMDKPKSEAQVAPYHQLKCKYYDPVKCAAGTGLCGHTDILCNSTASDKKIHCYALWRNSSGQVNLTKQGCWTDPNDDCHNTECVEDRHGQRDPFCCCSGEFCNEKYHLRPVGPPPTPTPTDGSSSPPVIHPQGHKLTVLKSLMPITAICIIVVLIFWMWRRHKANYHEPLPTHDPAPLPPASPSVGLLPLQLKELRNRGRYGTVWSATLFQQTVAVKIFPFHEQRSWMQERDIYMIPYMNDNSNILRFIGAERRVDQSVQEFWLISEFHERGSLYDYLKGNLISWPQLVHIAQTLARGLAFLHEDIPYDKTGQRKPAIAHRDFKSKNVLIKNDLSACLADFGLALKFEPGQSAGDTHGQVGTWRYMAPEVLEGAINFNRDAFFRIDMYACGLVLWELVSRCSASDGPVPDYQLPFEAEVGLRMTLEDINEVVVQKKLRPQLKDHWYKHSGLASILDTIQECWDQDAEARVSAGCIEERFTQLRKSIDQTLFSVAPPPSTIVAIQPTEEQVTCPTQLVPSNNALNSPSPNAVTPNLMTTMNISPTSMVNCGTPQDSYDSALEKSAVSSSSSDNQTSSDESLTVSLPEVVTMPSSMTSTTVVAMSSPRHQMDSNQRESTSPPRESTI